MPKFYQGVSFDSITVKEGDKEQKVNILMAEDEYNDISYRDYLKQGATERTQEQLRKKKPKEESRFTAAERSGVLKEYNEYNNRQKSEHKRKFF
jgi:hypothetical protein